MSKTNDFLDFTQQHTLTEQECELITFFRAFTNTQRKAIMQAVFSAALGDKRLLRLAEKYRQENAEDKSE